MEKLTRVFFITSSEESNIELFETLEGAENYLSSELGNEKGASIAVAIVRNAFKEEGSWNYDDLSDTFDFIKEI